MVCEAAQPRLPLAALSKNPDGIRVGTNRDSRAHCELVVGQIVGDAGKMQDGQPATAQAPWRVVPAVSPWLIGMGLALSVVVVYLPVWRAGFIWDDDQLLLDNPFIHQPDGWLRVWFHTDFPLALTSLWLEWRLWGNHPLGYHLVNVALHAMSAMVLWRVLGRLRVPGAALAAALFAVHPVNVESVAWISERKNTLAMVFYLLTLLWYLKFEENGTRRWYVLALVGFVLALFSKTAAAPLPLVLLGLAWWRKGRIERADAERALPFFAIAVAIGLLSVWFQIHQAIGSDVVLVSHGGFPARLAAAGWAVWFYLYKAVLPLNLSFIYPRWHIEPFRLWSYLPLLLLLGALLICWRFAGRWGRGLFFGLAYFVALLMPVVGFVSIYFMRYSLVADHWQYFAIIGPLTLAAAGLTTFFADPTRKLLWMRQMVAGGALLALGILAFRQVGVYSSPETLWRETLACNPNATLARWSLGNLLMREGRNEEAIFQFKKAVAVDGEADDILCSLGVAQLNQGRVEQAIAAFQEALRIRPTSVLALHNLGNALMRLGKPEEALVHFEKAVEIRPDALYTRLALAGTLLQIGRADEAVAQFRKALDYQPNSAEIRNGLGEALLKTGRTAEAAEQFELVTKLRPELPEPHLRLAELAMQQGRLAEAVPEFEKTLAIAPGIAGAHCNFGNVLLQIGKVDEAIAQFEQALKLEPGLAQAHNNLGNALFQKGRPSEGVAEYEAAVAAQPAMPPLLNNLAWALATCPEASVRNGPRAVELALKARQLSGGKNPMVLGTLAAAYAEAGRFPDAVTTARQAMELAAAQRNTAQTDELRARLALYEAGSPFRDQEMSPGKK
jgi:tetratricopeptide (TPR) repeat protein